MSETAPTTINRTLMRLPNAAYRPREYLTEAEVSKLIDAARRRGRNGLRDSAAILLAYRHGLRAQELCQLRWSQIDLRTWAVACEQGQGWAGERASAAWGGASGVTTAARAEPLCVRHRRRDASDDGLVPTHDPANRQSREAAVPGASAYAQAFDGLQTGK